MLESIKFAEWLGENHYWTNGSGLSKNSINLYKLYLKDNE